MISVSAFKKYYNKFFVFELFRNSLSGVFLFHRMEIGFCAFECSIIHLVTVKSEEEKGKGKEIFLIFGGSVVLGGIRIN